MADLRELAAAAAAGRPRVAVVLGEAGIGKTRLVAELADGLVRERALAAWGFCSAGAGRSLPLAPIRGVLESLHSQLGAGFGRLTGRGRDAVAALVPEILAVPGTGSPVLSQAQLFDVVIRLLRDVGQARALLVVIEDVHWADETSRDLLELLARSLRDERILLVLTARTDDPAFARCEALIAELGSLRHGVRVELARLSSDDVSAHVTALRGGTPAPDQESRRIAELSGGVPLLVEEVVAAGPDDVGHLAERVLGYRIDRLSPAARAVVDTAALAVLTASPDELSRAAPLAPGAFDAGYAEAVSAGVLVRRTGRVEFRHALLQEAALARILPGAEREAHRRWSAVLGDEPHGLGPLVAAAHHRRRGGDESGAVVASVRAASEARHLSAYAEEKRLLVQAADLWPRVPDAEERTGTNLWILYADAAWAAHLLMTDGEECRRYADLAVQALPADVTPHERAMLRLLWHRTRWGGPGHLPPDEVLACVADVTMDPPTESAMLACLEAVDALLDDGRSDRAGEFARRAVAVAESLDRPELLSRALASASIVAALVGDDADALATAHRAVSVGDRTEDVFVRVEALMSLATVQRTTGTDSLETHACLLRILGGDRPGPLPGLWAHAQVEHAVSLIEAGRWDEGRAALDLVIDEDVAAPFTRRAGRRRAHLEAWAVGAATPSQQAPAGLDRDGLIELCYLEADIAARTGDPALGRAWVRRGLDDERLSRSPTPRSQLLWVAARIEAELVGPAAAAEEGAAVVERIEELLGRRPPRRPQDLAFALHTRADLARRVQADGPEMWSDVVDAWRPVGLPFHLATALVRAGAAHAAHGRSGSAAGLLVEAHEVARRLGAGPLAEEAVTVARTAGLRRPAAASGDADLGLTPRELDVLRLVAEGASNSAIAATLVISPKTASVHVSNILAKLQVTNRGEAAAIAHRAGVVAPVAKQR